jgi:2-iminobutanoate/2-iminopropanoate deaminase
MEKHAVVSHHAPQAIGPYSQAVAAGGVVYCSGQLGLAPDSGALVPGGLEAESERALQNLKAVLDAAGSSLDRVVKTTVFLTDLTAFQALNAVYARHFRSPFPARSTVQVAALPRGACVEIEAVALLG